MRTRNQRKPGARPAAVAPVAGSGTQHGSRTGARPPLGQMLVDIGALSERDQTKVVALQSRIEARFGDILLARGLIDREQLYATIARQYDAEIARFDITPPDIRLIEAYGAERCLASGLLPWRHDAGAVVIATARPEQFGDRRAALEAQFGAVRMAVTGEVELHRALLENHPATLATQAETRVAAAHSCRNWPALGATRAAAVLAVATATGLLAAPLVVFWLCTLAALISLVPFTLLKLIILARHLLRFPRKENAAPAPIVARLPAVSVMVPLFRETAIAGRLIAQLDRLDYPRELLDICLVVEADDTATCTMLDNMPLPDHIRQIVVPASTLRTKPRALNYALDFCRGTIIGVYDAEDAPAPDQIRRVVQRFHERGPEVVCLQGVLDFYNARSNWISRCFTIEYASWFRVVLPGLARLGLVIPLGGTTLFFRREALMSLGGWDAHNVTEDADLGVRLARYGYRTELIDTVTQEEANCVFWPWVRQRSRWLKGYALTWAVHMRRPRQLMRDVGAWRFAGIQLLFGGTLAQFFLAPVLWSFWMIPLGLPHPAAGLSGALWQTIAGILAASGLINITVGFVSVSARGHRFLLPWVPMTHLYFAMAAVACYKGMAELATRPFFWDKTAHGLGQATDDADLASGARPLRRRA